MTTEQESIEDVKQAYALLFKENAKIRARVEQLEEAVTAFIEYDDNTDEDGISMMNRYAVAIELARSAQLMRAAA